MEIRTGSILFPRANGQGPRIGVQELVFPRPVFQAIAVLTGTNFGFSPRNDRELGRVNIWLQTAVASERVKVTATFGVRDWSRDWDDEYEGAVHYALLAELAPADGAGGMEPTAAQPEMDVGGVFGVVGLALRMPAR